MFTRASSRIKMGKQIIMTGMVSIFLHGMSRASLKLFFLFLTLLMGERIVSQPLDKMKVEQEPLEKARENIEKYRGSDAILTFTDSKGRQLKQAQVIVLMPGDAKQTVSFNLSALKETKLSFKIIE